MTSNLSTDLTALGDDLDRAITAQVHGTVRLRRARRLGKRSTVAGALAAAVVAVGGVAAAATLLSPADVADGMPAAAIAFAGVTPDCSQEGNDSYRCTVDGGVRSTEVSDWTGTIEPFADPDGKVAGGCRSQDAEGAVWLCYAGERAVEEGLIGADFLGEQLQGPGRG